MDRAQADQLIRLIKQAGGRIEPVTVYADPHSGGVWIGANAVVGSAEGSGFRRPLPEVRWVAAFLPIDD